MQDGSVSNFVLLMKYFVIIQGVSPKYLKLLKRLIVNIDTVITDCRERISRQPGKNYAAGW